MIYGLERECVQGPSASSSISCAGNAGTGRIQRWVGQIARNRKLILDRNRKLWYNSWVVWFTFGRQAFPTQETPSGWAPQWIPGWPTTQVHVRTKRPFSTPHIASPCHPPAVLVRPPSSVLWQVCSILFCHKGDLFYVIDLLCYDPATPTCFWPHHRAVSGQEAYTWYARTPSGDIPTGNLLTIW